MGLEKLKSIFSNIEKFNQSDVTKINSLHSISNEPQEVDYMDNDKVIGFTANLEHKSPSNIVGYGGSWMWNPTTNLHNVSNGEGIVTFQGSDYSFDNGLPISSDVTWTNSKTYYDSIHTTNAIEDIFSETWSYTNDIPSHGTTWNTGEESLTTYYDKIHTTNAISDTFGGPVNFLGGVNSYYTEVNPITETNLTSGIPGFTISGRSPNTEFNIGGYTFSDGKAGNSKFLQIQDMGGVEQTSMLSTGTHTIPIHPYGNQLSYAVNQTITFSDTAGGWFTDTTLPAGGDTTWNIQENDTPSLTDYYDSIHTTNAISDVFQGPVDFMSGLSSHEDSTLDSDYVIKGFTKDYDPGLFGGWTGADTTGDSKLLSMWAEDQDIGGNKYANIKTSYYTGYLDTPSNTIEFPGITVEDTLPRGSGNSIRGIYPFSLNFNPSFPGGYSADNPYGDSKFSNIDTDMHSVSLTGAGDETISFDGTIEDGYLFNWDNVTLRSGIKVNSSKGSNQGGQQSKQFNILYNKDQTVKFETDENGIISTTKYLGDSIDGSIVNSLDKFNLSSNLWTVNPNRVGDTAALGIFKTSTLLGELVGLDDALALGTNTEPYVISSIGNDDTHWTNQYFPKSRIEKDVQRVGKYLSSQDGEGFILQQNMLGTFQQYKGVYDPGSTLLNVAAPKEGVGTPMVNFSRDTGIVGSIVDLLVPNTYSEWIDERATGGNMFGNIADEIFNIPKNEESYAKIEQKKKPLAFDAGDALNNLADYFLTQMGLDGGGGTAIARDKVGGIGPSSGINSKNNMNISMGTTSPLGGLGKGDIKTLFPIDIDELNQVISSDLDLSKNTNGMPFYFKDLRDGVVINFRAYIEGLSETISPSWNSENYIGRSEPVYTYTSAEREIQFQLKLFAQTKDELNMIYKKMNRLTSLCYPEYKPLDVSNNISTDNGNLDLLKAEKNVSNDSRIMMKAPMVKFRLGELFGAGGTTDMNGFIKSLSYSFPDESPWEIKDGYRVPKYITADIGFQVIHSEVPSLNLAKLKDSEGKPTTGNTFYGVNKTLNSNNISVGNQIDDVISEIIGG